MAEGWRAARPGDDVRAVPMSDGGEGLLDAVEHALPDAQRQSVEIADARGYATTADWLLLADATAVIESAQACGLSRLAADLRNPRLATSYGVGQLIAAASDAGAARVVVGLGGSATVDGGAGAATALGHRLLRADGNGVKVGGEYLTALDRIVAGPVPEVPVIAAADVDAPLLGPDGAVAGFAAQKGATGEDADVLEEALATLARVAERDLYGGPWRDAPGAGAAGGLGFGLAAFLGAQLRPGAGYIAALVGLDVAIATADLVVTGEGALDTWSVRGKVPGAVADLAEQAGCPVFAVVGQQRAVVDRFTQVVSLAEPAEPGDAAQRVADATAKLAAQV
jgi:glycerate 2-kinase